VCVCIIIINVCVCVLLMCWPMISSCINVAIVYYYYYWPIFIIQPMANIDIHNLCNGVNMPRIKYQQYQY